MAFPKSASVSRHRPPNRMFHNGWNKFNNVHISVIYSCCIVVVFLFVFFEGGGFFLLQACLFLPQWKKNILGDSSVPFTYWLRGMNINVFRLFYLLEVTALPSGAETHLRWHRSLLQAWSSSGSCSWRWRTAWWKRRPSRCEQTAWRRSPLRSPWPRSPGGIGHGTDSPEELPDAAQCCLFPLGNVLVRQ